ncbi:MAG: aminopeptidase P family protein [Candidatus Moduliflexus flocculans]|nr:aminopeptidase P family protein [Candidatus Moduliflexus flocculans]
MCLVAAAGEYPAVLSLKDQAAVYDGWLSVAAGQGPARAHAAGEDRHVAGHLPGVQRGPRLPVARSVRQPVGPPAEHAGHVRPGRGQGRREVRRQPLRRRQALSRRSGRPARRTSGRPWPEPSRSAIPRGSASTNRTSSPSATASARLSRRSSSRPSVRSSPKRLAGAERLAVGWLERRLPEEIEVYDRICAIAHAVIAEAFSSAVITPGVTTAADVEWWIWEKFRALGQTTWFNPGISIQRPKTSPYKDSPVIHPGDLLHCDIGINYLRLNTDTQQHAYVLRPGRDRRAARV